MVNTIITYVLLTIGMSSLFGFPISLMLYFGQDEDDYEPFLSIFKFFFGRLIAFSTFLPITLIVLAILAIVKDVKKQKAKKLEEQQQEKLQSIKKIEKELWHIYYHRDNLIVDENNYGSLSLLLHQAIFTEGLDINNSVCLSKVVEALSTKLREYELR